VITIKLKVHKIKLNHNNNFIDEEGYAQIDLKSDSTIKDLIALLEINLVGKVILVNGVSCKVEAEILISNDKIGIFQLIAGG
jgi:sulfur carrier protein ThiS